MRYLVICLVIFSIFFNAFSLFSVYDSIGNYNLYTGNFIFGSVTATISFFVEGGIFSITIYSPLNTTYNFNIGDNYTLDLNVSASEPVSLWRYNLYDARHEEYAAQNVLFTPNITFDAVRGSNTLEIYADNLDSSQTANRNVTFFVSVPNSAPLILNLTENNFVCEGDSFSSVFNVSDADEDSLVLGVSPSNPFFIIPIITSSGVVLSPAEVFSGILGKNRVNSTQGYKLYEEVVSANDGQYVDTKPINITVIEINNEPEIEFIGVQTVYTQGEQSSFDYQVNATDAEDGNSDSGNLSFNLTFSGDALFEINSTNGVINYTPDFNDLGVYTLSVCVTDEGISPVHPNISICGQDGGPITACQNFSLTVTDENRPPSIIDNYPLPSAFNISGTENSYFNITKNDPDGTIPDAYWRVDGVLQEIDSGSSVDEFNYIFGCGVSGNHSVNVEITDGLLNDTFEWDITVLPVTCPTSSGGGGGGGGADICSEKWGCEEWNTCQHAGISYQRGLINTEDYNMIKEGCQDYSIGVDNCGYQLRSCDDINLCQTNFSKPLEVQSCFYVPAPSCSDGIENCHDGSCELLIDCGGSCGACATCSDGIQNQAEQGVDCGGACPNACPQETPFLKTSQTRVILILAIIVILIIIIFIVRRIYKIKLRINKRIR